MEAWPPEGTVLDLICPPQTDVLHLIRGVVVSVSREIGFPPDDASQIELSVDEACTNVIRHAYGDTASEPSRSRLEQAVLRVQIRPAADRLAIRVIDRGRGLPRTRPPGVVSLEEYLSQPEPKGLGLFIIGKFMDEVVYDSPPGSGTVLSMVKYLRPPSGQ
jgi:anti-sigma regulatory factor (Ser/Thr protein kinase)